MNQLPIDPILAEDLRDLASRPGPWATATLTTHRAGPETRAGATRLANLADEADRALREGGTAAEDADRVVASLRALVEDYDFWQQQGEGLIVLASPDDVRTYRVHRELPERVQVGRLPDLVPLVEFVQPDQRFLILALTLRSARVLEATATSVEELDLPDVPATLEGSEFDRDREPQFQSVPQGGGEATFHGHAGDSSAPRARAERYFRAVGRGLAAELGRRPRPVVLATVETNATPFRQASGVEVLDEIVAGNPEERSPEELHRAAWPLVADRLGAEQAVEEPHAGDPLGAEGEDRLLELAQHGRVDTLFVAQDSVGPRTAEIVGETLLKGGRLVSSDAGRPLRARLRY